jgi:hypothetical protein
MLRLSTTVSLALLALPPALAAQSAAGSSAAQRPVVAAVTVGSDPWLIIYRGVASTTQARASRATVRANVDRLDAALGPYGTTYTALTDEDRALVRNAFVDLVPRQRFSGYRLNDAQARSIIFLALGPVERLQPVPACERRDRDRDRDGDRDRRDHDGRPPVPARSARSAACQSQLDSLSRDAAWIHTTILAMGRTGARRPRAEDQADLQAMSESARAMVLSVNRCGCPAASADAESLLTASREALDAFNASGMAAWMSLGSPRVDKISKLSESLERTLIRCLSE